MNAERNYSNGVTGGYIGTGRETRKLPPSPTYPTDCPRQELSEGIEELRILVNSMSDTVSALAGTLAPICVKQDEVNGCTGRPWVQMTTAVSTSIQDISRRVYEINEALCNIHGRTRI